MAEIIIGIDLGTTNSLVAYCDEAGPRCLRAGERTGHTPPRGAEVLVPSIVHFAEDGTRIVGAAARRQAVLHPRETVYSIKRLMGVGWEQAQNELPHLAYEVVPGTSSDIVNVKVREQLLSPQEISALILREIKRRADAYFGTDVRKAVITVPAYFDDSQRQATRDAGRIAGLDVLRIINEPTAAALAYGLGLKEGGGGTIAVYDLGGGTFDISILAVDRGVFQVLATHGDTHLGGDDCDREIIALVMRDIRAQFGQELAFPPSAQQALREFAEATKIKLSTERSANIEVELGSGRVYRRTITREEFEVLIRPWVAKTLEHCQTALKLAGKRPEDMDHVVMVGGMTRVPLVLQEIEEFFCKIPYTAVNPDEVVALGAAVQGSILAGIRRDTLLLDVIPLSLGIETMGGAVSKLIMAQTRIPCTASEMFTTYVDGQTSVKIHVLQGERELVADCRSLANFDLRGLPAMPAGLPKIRVTFLVDANGILNVSAVEERSNTAAAVQVLPSHGLSRGQVRQMMIDALAYASDDMLAHRLIDLRNQVQLDTQAIAKSLAVAGAQLETRERQNIETALARVQELAKTDDAEAIWAALVELDALTVHLAEVAIAETLRKA